METIKGLGRLTTIQAAICLSSVSTLDAMDKIGSSYLHSGITAAHELDLFESSSEVESKKMQRARAFTAWGLYGWVSSVYPYCLELRALY